MTAREQRLERRRRSPREVALRLVRGPGGVVRLVGVVCVVVALARGPVDSALFLLVLAGLLAPVLARAHPALDAAYGVGLLAAAWSGALGLYEAVAWLDVVMHLVVTGLVAAVTHLVLARRTGAVVDPARVPRDGGRRVAVGAVVVTFALGLALSVQWEIGEYLGQTYADPEIFADYPDTIGDMVVGGLGSTVAGIGLLLGGRRRT